MQDAEILRKYARFALLLPVCAILVTSALWLRARSQFSLSCLDCVPIPLQLAGMLNGPVAPLAYPFYPLVQGDASTRHLALLLVAIALQWAYIGYVIDKRHSRPRQRTIWRCTVGLLGVLFAFGSIAVAICMYHLGLLYKVAALAWSLLMAYHFLGFLKKVPGANLPTSVSSS
jgi:hypothetical protein